jgi:hypothetical protein
MRTLDALQSRTFRWNDGEDVERYDAVEASASGLVWYGWSHVPPGGRHDERRQTWDELERDGPARPCPPQVLDALRAMRAPVGAAPRSGTP